MTECTCAEWRANISKIVDGVRLVMAIRWVTVNGDRIGVDAMPPLAFCPWCGTKLPEDEVKS